MPTEVVVVLVNRATTVAVGTEPGDQFPVESQAAPLVAVDQVFVVT
jgi:homoaconitase/3-isopropylmalate dehydratase large subunit